MDQLINEYDYSDSAGEERKASPDIKVGGFGFAQSYLSNFLVLFNFICDLCFNFFF